MTRNEIAPIAVRTIWRGQAHEVRPEAVSALGLMSRLRGSGRPGTLRKADSADEAHLVEFARTREGVEAFVEPQTAVTATTMVFVARSGEWTRRRMPDPKAAHDLANRLGVPSYDAAVVGYPQRMRDWNARPKHS